ncbi:GNAT superfamily N-acetyltransferase [Algoriphagus iocasae]|uniref:GNAT superfamily N-acetyltransferase n=1 Tax=Algoriphagus iocasae TaxID=1836499 RepID=A0A841MRX9_9BACT|nr:GNAT family N-acetyltransferase [Algoriphagus iocasae]MBB6325295.1 GNAT superfamily N-acetyltransferase [Algoriphagus iocasae]
MISIQTEQTVTLEEFMKVLDESGLGKRRPMDDQKLLNQMILGTNLWVTAREEGTLIGLMRGISDYCYRTFVADLAVIKSYQGKGIGTEILTCTREVAPTARLFLFSAEDAEGFYKKLGFHLHERCYQLKTGEPMS